MMKCVNCNHEQDNGKFCGKCGTPFAVDNAQVENEKVVQPEVAATVNGSVGRPSPNPAPSTQPNGGRNLISEFLHFDKMITPSIIKFVFWIGSGLIVLAGLISMISGAASDYGGGFQVLLGLIIILVGPFIIRIYCELLILFFKIHETLQETRKGN